MAGLPDDWQLNGFDDEAARWWMENEFTCEQALLWRDAKWYSFDPETARRWVDAGVDVAEATEWMEAHEETEYDVIDMITRRAAGMAPADLEPLDGDSRGRDEGDL